MPWLSIVMAIISFIMSKKSGASDSRAAAVGAVAGLGTYYVTHETEWGRSNLGALDGVITTPNVAPDGTAIGGAPGVGTNGAVIPTGTVGTTGSTSGFWDTLQSWGPTGTAAVIGTAGVTTGTISLKSMLPWIIGGVALFALLK